MQQSFQSSVVNLEAEIPQQLNKRRNKTDFYRYLLSQNFDKSSLKINNDLLIPRSILKRNNPGGLIKDNRLHDATEEYIKYQQARFNDKMRFHDDVIGKYDALFGQNILPTNKVFDPKFK